MTTEVNIAKSLNKAPLLAGVLAVALGFCAAPEKGLAESGAKADDAGRLWRHDGSLMRLEKDGNDRRFYCVEPSKRMSKVGIKPGTLLFEGKEKNGEFKGFAYLFHSGCAGVPYEVAGSQWEQQIILNGKAPQINQDCKIVGRESDELTFTFGVDSEKLAACKDKIRKAVNISIKAIGIDEEVGAPEFSEDKNSGFHLYLEEDKKLTAMSTGHLFVAEGYLSGSGAKALVVLTKDSCDIHDLRVYHGISPDDTQEPVNNK